MRIDITVPRTYTPPNDHTLLHHAILQVSSDGTAHPPNNKFRVSEVLLELHSAGLSEDAVEKAKDKLLADGTVTLELDNLNEEKLRTVGLL